MWTDNGRWCHFNDIHWDTKSSSHWIKGNWNSFYDINENFNNDSINSIIFDINKKINRIITETDKKINNLKRDNKQQLIKKISGVIKFSYKIDDKKTFKRNWDDRINDLNKVFKEYDIESSIDTDNAEYDRKIKEVVALINFKIKNSLNNIEIVDHIFKSSFSIRKKHNIIFEKITINDKDIFNYKKDSYVDKENSKVKEEPAIKTSQKKSEIEKPQTKWIKLIDYNKKRFNKCTFEIIKKIDKIDDIPVNCYIVKQIRGNKNRKRYTLNANDCELLGIEYHDYLEVLPGDLKYENVYKKVKNENYKEK